MLGLLKVLMYYQLIFLLQLLLYIFLILRLILLANLERYTRDQVRWTWLIPILLLGCRWSCLYKSAWTHLQAWVILHKLWKTRALFWVLGYRLAKIYFFGNLFLVKSVKVEIFMLQSFLRFYSLFRVFYKHLHYQILHNSGVED